jgi:predicted transcriptional regulator
MIRKNITIQVRSLGEVMSEFLSVVRDAQAGKIGPPRVGLSFESIDAVRNVLTPKRLGLLKAIREGRPKSVYALAKATGRPLKNTQDDVAMLARLDLVELKRGHGKRSALEPRVRYDSIRLDIPLHHAR